MRFQLVHLIYIVTLLAAAFASLGSLGLLPGLLALFYWALHILDGRIRTADFRLRLATLFGVVAIAVSLELEPKGFRGPPGSVQPILLPMHETLLGDLVPFICLVALIVLPVIRLWPAPPLVRPRSEE